MPTDENVVRVQDQKTILLEQQQEHKKVLENVEESIIIKTMSKLNLMPQ